MRNLIARVALLPPRGKAPAVPAGIGCVLLALALVPAMPAPAQAPDVRAIQAREAQKTDERTLLYLQRFRVALEARAGADPLLSMLVFDEQEAQVLLHASPAAPAQHLIWQQGQWVSTDGRQLRLWAPQADPGRARFRLSAVSEAFVRDRMRAHRAKPAQATDHLGPIRVGYFGKPFDRVIVELQVASLTNFGLSAVQFDLATGEGVDVAGATQQARAQREQDEKREAEAWEAVAHRDLRKEVPAIVAAFRREIGPARLMAIYVRRDQVRFIQSDRATVDYDRRGRFVRRAAYEHDRLCAEGFDEGAIAWDALPAMVQVAMQHERLDEEDRGHAEFDVERPRGCKPVNIEVRFTNYKLPQPSASFDASGRLQGR